MEALIVVPCGARVSNSTLPVVSLMINSQLTIRASDSNASEMVIVPVVSVGGGGGGTTGAGLELFLLQENNAIERRTAEKYGASFFIGWLMVEW